MAIWLVLMRETLEISLLLNIFIVSLKDVAHKKYAISLGIILGVVSSIIFGFSINYITNFFEGKGQEICQIFILSSSIILIYNNLRWIKKTIKLHKEKLNNLATAESSQNFFSISTIISLIILKEGMEIFLFVYSIVISKNIPLFVSISQSLIGVSVGLIIGLLLYKGLVKIPQRYLFKITSWFFTFLAASMASHLVNLLSSIDLISLNNFPVWDSSFILSENSPLGKFLSNFIGYNSRPSAAELIVYLSTILIFFQIQNNRPQASLS